MLRHVYCTTTTVCALVQQYSSVYFRRNAQISSSFIKMCQGEMCKVNPSQLEDISWLIFLLKSVWASQHAQHHSIGTTNHIRQICLTDQWQIVFRKLIIIFAILFSEGSQLHTSPAMKRFIIWRFQKQNPLYFFLPLKQTCLFMNV